MLYLPWWCAGDGGEKSRLWYARYTNKQLLIRFWDKIGSYPGKISSPCTQWQLAHKCLILNALSYSSEINTIQFRILTFRIANEHKYSWLYTYPLVLQACGGESQLWEFKDRNDNFLQLPASKRGFLPLENFTMPQMRYLSLWFPYNLAKEKKKNTKNQTPTESVKYSPPHIWLSNLLCVRTS